MAIFHMSGTVISRSQGRSAVACAAYRSGEILKDERYDKTHDYTQKQDIAHTEILLPAGAPEWMKDREKLWNAVESAEKRKDAQLAREFNISLPRELTLEQNIKLAQEFVKAQFVEKGMVADLCLHNDKTHEGEAQPHLHVMLTMREVTENGFGQKVRAWNAKENILQWREAWAELANHHLALHGHEARIDHRTLAEQGIALEPQYKIGPSAARSQMARLEEHQRIAKENGEKLFAHPEIALTALTRQQSTFTHHDLARFVSRHTLDAEQFQLVFEKVKACEQLLFLGKDENQKERFTTQTMLAVETTMLADAKQLAERPGHAVQEKHQELTEKSKTLTPEQAVAFHHILERGDLKCVTGFAGTGKSYLLGAVKEAYEADGYRVLGATLSGIAAQNLEGSSGIASRTLASRFHYWNKGEQLLTKNDVLVVDEAGMVGSRQKQAILEQAKQQGAKVVLLGDPEQLQSIEAGAAFRAISEQVGRVELTEIRRQKEGWQQEATREFATLKTADAIERYRAHDHLHVFETPAESAKGLIQLWNDVRLSTPEKTQLMLAYTRAEVKTLNEMAREKRQQQGELKNEQLIPTERGERRMAPGDRVYFLKNDRQLGVMNGTLGTVQAIEGQQLAVALDRDTLTQKDTRAITLNLSQYAHLDHGYAATIHKAQGSTVDRSYLLASKYLDRHATYVAGTRHKESLEIVYDKQTFPDEKALIQTLSRERTKDTSLDYDKPRPLPVPSAIEKESLRPALSLDMEFTPEQIARYNKMLAEPVDFKNLKTPHLDAAMNRDKHLQASKLVMKQEASRPAFSPDTEFTPEQIARYNQFFARPLSEFQDLKTPYLDAAMNRDKFLQESKLEFERAHPEEAQRIKDMCRPKWERDALAIEKQFAVLEKDIQSKKPYAKSKLEDYAVGVSEKTAVMDYFKTQNPNLSQKIEDLTKSHEHAKQWDEGMERGF